LRSDDPIDSARWIRSIACSRSRAKRVEVKPYRRAVGRRDPVAVRMLCSIPGVSMRNARELVDSFASTRAIANASVDALCVVPGIGPRTSARIHDAFNQLL